MPAIGAATASGSGGQPHRDLILSNERTYATWAVANYASVVRVAPDPAARRVGKLRLTTPDGFLESFILLREHWTHSKAWVKLRVPGRPNGRTGWVPRPALESFAVTHKVIVVDRAAERLTVYHLGRSVFRAPVGTGKPSTPTPSGHFWITEGFRSNNPFYGPWAFATSDYSSLVHWPGGGVVGLHGTNEPSLVPGHPSHGCIRLHNRDILRLKRLVAIGTPVIVK